MKHPMKEKEAKFSFTLLQQFTTDFPSFKFNLYTERRSSTKMGEGQKIHSNVESR